MNRGRRHVTRILAGLGVAAVLACGEQTAPPEPDSLDAAPELTLVEELRIGSFDDPAAGFSRITGAAVADDGRIVVFDVGDAQFRTYSPEGEPLTRFGGRGQGPGEFTSPPTFGVRDGTIWASEVYRRRLQLFSLDGELRSSTTHGALSTEYGGFRLTLAPLGLDADGQLPLWPIGRRSRQVDGEARRSAIPRVRIDAGGEIGDTIGWLEGAPPRLVPPEGDAPPPRSIRIDGEPFYVPTPPSGRPRWLGAVDGHLVFEAPIPTTEEGRVILTRLDLTGDTLYSRWLSYKPSSYSEADLTRIA